VKQRTFRVLALLLLAYGLAVAPGFVWPAYFESAAGLLVMVPILSIYLFHWIGIPGLLEHNGLCGWGWCSPTVLGWIFLVAFWSLSMVLLAWGIAALTRRISIHRNT
jgi:hypothetical protein